MKSWYYICALFALLMPAIVSAQPEIPEQPSPPRLVNNLSREFPDFFSPPEQEALEQKLVNFEKETSNQILVLVVDDLGGYDENAFATEVGHKWGVGQGKFDNGVVILIKPTGGDGDRVAYIAVGYGLEGAITDITATEIAEKEMISEFQKGNFYGGVDAAVNVIMQLAKGEITAPEYSKSKSGKGIGKWVWIVIVLIIVMMIRGVLKGWGSGGGTIGRRGFYGGSFGGGSWGGGRSFGGGGSSFGGFGGGGFGGGGGGGRW